MIRSRTPVDLLTWAPTSASRRRRRGYDQAQLLARAIGRHAEVPVTRALGRRSGAVQYMARACDPRWRALVF